MTLVIDQTTGWASVEAVHGEVNLAVGAEHDANEYMLHLSPHEAFKLGKALYRAGLLLGVKPKAGVPA